MWKPIAEAPFGQELQLAVIDIGGAHSLVFPCRRKLHGWAKAETNEEVDIVPTHWRPWLENMSMRASDELPSGRRQQAPSRSSPGALRPADFETDPFD